MTQETAIIPTEHVNLGVLEIASEQVVARATAIAKVLADVINDRKLYSNIQGKRFVRAEGWATLGAMLGVLPREVEVTEAEDGSYTAKVELIRTSDGRIIGGASAMCGADEKRWATAERYARRSMAITRATGKAYRLGFAWIMSLAGYEVTPAEEIPEEIGPDHSPAPQQPPATRPYPPELVRQRLGEKADSYAKSGKKASEKQRGLVAGVLEECYAGEGAKEKRHSALQYLTGKDSLGTDVMPDWYVLALLDWLNPEKDSGGLYLATEMAEKEAQAILVAALREAGQADLPLDATDGAQYGGKP